MSTIMWCIELVEGKDAPPERNTTTSPYGKTVSLLPRMCSSISSSRGMVIILDSGFCVLRGLIELKKIGVFASAVIKKRRFWPKHVPGDAMDERMSTKEIGHVDTLKGVIDGVPYDLFCMKDIDYTMKLMSTYGSPLVNPDTPEKYRVVNGVVTPIKYTEPFANHYLYRHAVDDHNNLRHSGISLEETSLYWPSRR
jgi:hypothetical protein